MNFSRLVLAAVFLTACVFLSDVSALTNVTDCGTLSSANETYVLNKSLSSGSTCITVGANNITLDCQGYVINYSSTSAGYGVYVDSYNYTAVENCTVNLTGEYGHAYAVYYLNSNNGTVYNNTIMTLQSAAYYDFGVYLDGGSYNNLSSNNITTSGYSGNGFDVEDSSTNNSFTSNNITTSGENGYGFFFYSSSDSNTVFNNRVVTSGSWGRAIYGVVVLSFNVSNNVVVTSNTGGVGIDLEAGSSHVVVGNNVTTAGESADGVSLSGDSNDNVTGNNVTVGASASGVYLGGDSNDLVTGNNVTAGAGASGVYLDGGSNDNVTGNNVTGGTGGYGIVLGADSNNSVTGNNVTVGASGYGVLLSGNSNDNVTGNNVTAGASGCGVYLTSSNNNSFSSDVITASGSGAYGVYLSSSSNNSFADTSVTTSGSTGLGVYLKSSSNSNNFTGCSVQTSNANAYVVYLYSSTGNLFKDSVLNASSSGVADVYARGTGVNNFTNCSFNKSDTNFYSGATASVNVFWYLNVHTVNNSGADLASVTLNISDVNGTSLYNGTANSSGWMSSPLTVQEYVQNITGVYNKTPHWINASKAGYDSNNSQSTVSQNTVVTRALELSAYVLSLTSPANSSCLNASVTLSGFTAYAGGYVNSNISFSLDGGSNTSLCTNCSTFSNPMVVSEGSHNITVYGVGFDNASSTNSKTVWFTADLTPPVAELGGPVNNFNSTNQTIVFQLKCSDELGVGVLQLWGNWIGAWQANQTNSSPANNTYWNASASGVPEGTWTWGAYCNDSVGNIGWSDVNKTIIIRTLPAIQSPLNQSYNENWVWANVSLNFNGSWCGYSLNGAANVSMSNDSRTHFYYNVSSISDGNYNISFWCNDSGGFMRNSQTTYFTVLLVPVVSETGTQFVVTTNYYAMNVSKSNCGITDVRVNGVNKHIGNIGGEYNPWFPEFEAEHLGGGVSVHSNTIDGAADTSLLYNSTDVTVIKCVWWNNTNSESSPYPNYQNVSWYFVFLKDKPYVTVELDRSVVSTQVYSNGQQCSMWSGMSIPAGERSTVYNGSITQNTHSVAGYQLQYSPFTAIDRGLMQMYPFQTTYDSVDNISTGIIVTSVTANNRASFSTFETRDQGWGNEYQYNWFGRPDTGSIRLFNGTHYGGEFLLVLMNGTIDDTVKKVSEDLFNARHYDELVAENYYTAGWGSRAWVDNYYVTANNNFIMTGRRDEDVESSDYTMSISPLPYSETQTNPLAVLKVVKDGTNLVRTDTFPADRNVADGDGYRSGWAKWTYSSVNNTLSYKVYNDSDKLVVSGNLVPTAATNITQLYVELTYVNTDAVQMIDNATWDLRWNDPVLGWCGATVYSPTNITAIENTGSALRLYVVNNSANQSYDSSSNWSYEFWIYPHEGNVSAASDVTPLHTLPTKTYKEYYKKLPFLESNTNFGYRPNYEVVVYSASDDANANLLDVSTYAEAGAHTIYFYLNKTGVSGVKKNSVSLSSSEWSFNSTSKVLSITTNWSSPADFTIDYSTSLVVPSGSTPPCAPCSADGVCQACCLNDPDCAGVTPRPTVVVAVPGAPANATPANPLAASPSPAPTPTAEVGAASPSPPLSQQVACGNQVEANAGFDWNWAVWLLVLAVLIGAYYYSRKSKRKRV